MELIHVIVYFENRKATPVKFKYQGVVYDVKQVLEQKDGKNVWGNNPNQIYTVITKDGKKAELEWVVDTGEWMLNHIELID